MEPKDILRSGFGGMDGSQTNFHWMDKRWHACMQQLVAAISTCHSVTFEPKFPHEEEY